MSDILKKPYDSVDLTYLLPTFGTPTGTLYPLAFVYDPNNNLVAGAPFVLTLIGNNLYGKTNAFQAAVDSGSYKVIYIPYDDAAHTIQNSQFGESLDTITVSIQAVSGWAGSQGKSAEFYYNDDPIKELIKSVLKNVISEIKKIKEENKQDRKTINDEVSKLSSKNGAIEKKLESIINLDAHFSKVIKGYFSEVKDGIKKNRSTILKSRFDKKIMTPIISTVANMELKSDRALERLKIDLTNTLEVQNETNIKKFAMTLDDSHDKAREKTLEVLSNLDESIRKKLKFAVDSLRSAIMMVKNSKQEIKLTVKKDD